MGALKHKLVSIEPVCDGLRTRALIIGVVLCLYAGSGIASVQTEDLPSSILSDSLHGWAPSHGEQDEALAIAMSFFRRIDQSSYAEAYAMFAESFKALASEAAFEASEKAFNIKAGPVIERRPTAVTWTNHPSTMSNPGIFAAIDFVERYKNVDRACSYLILVKTDNGSGMRVLRVQMASLDNATASEIASKGPPGAVDRAWRALAQQYPHCLT